jgi:hypothetical protein
MREIVYILAGMLTANAVGMVLLSVGGHWVNWDDTGSSTMWLALAAICLATAVMVRPFARWYRDLFAPKDGG